MSKFLSRFKGEKEDRSDLAPTQSAFSSNNPYGYTQSPPPAYQPQPESSQAYASSSNPTQNNSHHTSPDDNLPPYHDWTSIPDTALLPPPPPIANEYSTASNATYDEAAAARAWCARYPVYTPKVPNVHLIETIQAGQHLFDQPADFKGIVTKLNQETSPSSFTTNAYGATPTVVFHISTNPPAPIASNSMAQPQLKSGFSRLLKSQPSSSSTSSKPLPPPGDQILLSLLPLYFASTSSPLSPHFASSKPTPQTVYFELKPLAFRTPDSTVSIGYAAKPYPPHRQPGWHRASVAVHSDDGNRYINDSWGGREFTSPFRAGETIGLAIEVLPEAISPKDERKKNAVLQSEREVSSVLPRCKTRSYFKRNGRVEGSWDVNEERDAELDEGVAGLMGETDLYAAVGMFGAVEFEVCFFEGGEGFVPPPPMT